MGNADDLSFDEIGDNLVLGDAYPLNTRISANHSIHTAQPDETSGAALEDRPTRQVIPRRNETRYRGAGT